MRKYFRLPMAGSNAASHSRSIRTKYPVAALYQNPNMGSMRPIDSSSPTTVPRLKTSKDGMFFFSCSMVGILSSDTTLCAVEPR